MRYRLPDSMGGHEIHMYPGWQDTAGITRVKVEYEPGQFADISLPPEKLVAIKPELPEEPVDVGAVFLVGTEVYQRGDPEPYSTLPWGGRWDWQDWATLCERSQKVTGSWPVRLVPDPAVGVELPWDRHGWSVRTSFADDDPCVVITAPMGPNFFVQRKSPSTARALAAVLLAAADAAEKEQP